MQSTANRWRPCCGQCRGERLREHGQDDPLPNAEHGWSCLDCGASWDGSELSAAEAAQRPPLEAPPARTTPS
jgi:hypothetical protein